MERWNRMLFMVLALAVLGVALSFTGASPATAEALKPVEVVNTPTVNAQQSGSWNVGITGMPNVNVANTEPLQVEAVHEQVFQAKAHLDIPIGGDPVQSTAFAVPAGKRAVIEFVSVEGQQGLTFSDTTGVAMALVTVTDNLAFRYPLPMFRDPTQPGKYVGAQLVRIYTNPGPTDIQCYLRQTTLAVAASGDCSFTGHLVDVP